MTVVLPESAEAAKARGAFYTPPEITRFLSKWAIRAASDTVLEPSAGDGAFLTAITERFAELSPDRPAERILAIEREPSEADKAKSLAPDAEVRTVDFFDLEPASTRPRTAVVGNPPYVRYQGFRGPDRSKALARAREQGIELTGLASSWAHFVVHATGFLEDGGRLALVLPAELLHTDYAAPVRSLLMHRFPTVTIVAFDRPAFRSAQVDAVLLLASDDEPHGFRVIRLADVDALSTLDPAQPSGSLGMPSRWSASVDEAAADVYLKAIADGAGVRLGSLAEVDIGFVSGANDFFVLSHQKAALLGLPQEFLTPAIRRPSDVPGLYVRDGESHVLLDLAGRSDLDDATAAYLADGERLQLDLRYKCRTRSPWYAVPLPKRMPDAFLPYMHHLGPRLIVNNRRARNSNLLHGVAFRLGSPAVAALSVAMASSLTLLSAEIEGRAYGGGVLKLETKEAERLLVANPDDPDALAGCLPKLDGLVRAGEIKRAALVVDGVLGLPHARLWEAYETLRARRLGRRVSKPA